MEKKEAQISKNEDIAAKVTWQYFKDEVLPYFGIEGKVVGMMPTEMIQIELKKMLEDMNFLMENGTVKHFEFQKSNDKIYRRNKYISGLSSYCSG